MSKPGRIPHEDLPAGIQTALAQLQLALVRWLPDVAGAQVTIDSLDLEKPPTVDVRYRT